MSKSPNKRRPNNWFRFKQFTIRQEGAAMKVGTDGVLLGAWATVPVPGSRVLDVGSGTGLIALMLAQRTLDVHVDALEIDPSSAEQALENFQASPWADRIACFQTSLQDYTPVSKFKYELIICNPPFFTSSLKTSSREKNLARHDDSLSLEDLLSCSTSLLTPTGTLSLVQPISCFTLNGLRFCVFFLTKPHPVLIVAATHSKKSIMDNNAKVLCLLNRSKKNTKEFPFGYDESKGLTGRHSINTK
jgi:tRNA1(Val) A37 N6-methylase TrmN6